jgi:hypothetical protein
LLKDPNSDWRRSGSAIPRSIEDCPLGIIHGGTQSFERKSATILGELLEQIEHFFALPVSGNTTSHILRGFSGVKRVTGVSMGSAGVMVNPERIDPYYWMVHK